MAKHRYTKWAGTAALAILMAGTTQVSISGGDEQNPEIVLDGDALGLTYAPTQAEVNNILLASLHPQQALMSHHASRTINELVTQSYDDAHFQSYKNEDLIAAVENAAEFRQAQALSDRVKDFLAALAPYRNVRLSTLLPAALLRRNSDDAENAIFNPDTADTDVPQTYEDEDMTLGESILASWNSDIDLLNDAALDGDTFISDASRYMSFMRYVFMRNPDFGAEAHLAQIEAPSKMPDIPVRRTFDGVAGFFAEINRPLPEIQDRLAFTLAPQ